MVVSNWRIQKGRISDFPITSIWNQIQSEIFSGTELKLFKNISFTTLKRKLVRNFYPLPAMSTPHHCLCVSVSVSVSARSLLTCMHSLEKKQTGKRLAGRTGTPSAAVIVVVSQTARRGSRAQSRLPAPPPPVPQRRRECEGHAGHRPGPARQSEPAASPQTRGSGPSRDCHSGVASPAPAAPCRVAGTAPAPPPPAAAAYTCGDADVLLRPVPSPRKAKVRGRWQSAGRRHRPHSGPSRAC